MSEVVLKQAEKQDVSVESFLKRLSSLQRILVDFLFISSSAIGLRAIRQEMIYRLTIELFWFKWMHDKHKDAIESADKASIRSVRDEFLNQTKTVHARQLLLVANKAKKVAESDSTKKTPYDVIIEEKILTVPGHSTIKNALETLEAQGFVISTQTDSFRAKKLYTLSPVFDSFLRKRKYDPRNTTIKKKK